MGTDKASLEIGGATMAARAAQALLGAGLTEVFLVGAKPSLSEMTGLRGVADMHPGAGPLGAVITALHAVADSFDAVVTIPCDIIEPDPRAVRAVLDGLRRASAASDAVADLEVHHAAGSGCALAERPDCGRGDSDANASRSDADIGGCPAIVVPVAEDGRQWLHAAWRRTCLSALSAAFDAGERAPRRAVRDLCVVSVEVAGSDWRRDADRPEDLVWPEDLV